MRRCCLLLPLIALAACGGGGPPGDVFVVKRSGSVPEAKLTLRITDDGGAYCNDASRAEISSEQLIEAREIRRTLNGDPREPDKEPGIAKLKLSLPATGATIYSYSVLSEEGTFAFHESSRGQPVVSRIVKLTHDIATGPCRLSR